MQSMQSIQRNTLHVFNTIQQVSNTRIHVPVYMCARRASVFASRNLWPGGCLLCALPCGRIVQSSSVVPTLLDRWSHLPREQQLSQKAITCQQYFLSPQISPLHSSAYCSGTLCNQNSFSAGWRQSADAGWLLSVYQLGGVHLVFHSVSLYTAIAHISRLWQRSVVV